MIVDEEYELVRTFEVTYKDRTVETVRSESYPWQYRKWLCVSDNGEVLYRPMANVAHWKEVVD
jgi:hypothetical protein